MEKKAKSGKALKKSDVVEKVLTISLKKIMACSQNRRANKAVIVLRELGSKHFRVLEKNVSLSPALNELVWNHGIEHVPKKIELKGLKDGLNLRLYLKDEKIEKPVEKLEEKPGKKTAEEKEKEEELEKKREEKKILEKEAEAIAIKKGIQ